MEILRDEFLAHMLGPDHGRPLFAELFGTLVGLADEWRAQGASEAEIALTAFGFDHFRRHVVNVNTGPLTPYADELLEDTPAHQIRRDRYGRRAMLCKGAASIPLPLDHPVRDMDSWLRVKSWYQWSEKRFAPGWLEQAKKARDTGAVIAVCIPGGFDECAHDTTGFDWLCIAGSA